MKSQSNISLIAAEFHKKRIETMCNCAQEKAKELGLKIADEIWVPGCFEIPIAAARILREERIAGAVVLGIIEKGETKHGLVMAEAVFAKVLSLQLQFDKPVGLGIIGPEATNQQIDARLEKHARAAVVAVSKILQSNNSGG